ncbi:MFS transporter [Paeniglutamicibacter cryotolerans]|uniref:MFS family permease n=1 Tax=Paeniglutamicibacter cryotolerans TaxID=670079 RepID=A0A839QR86_9MICC|nr:MFS transporter [Paeniglutamicibacter cryotolerans]MBB2995772.1 MFS family permease [Paeniglutamicibacter cryotolerans]
MTTKQNASPGDAVGKTYHASPKDMRRILLSSFLGTAVEYYDFILYATAAGIVFNQVFFAGLDPNLAIFVSFGTLAVGYIARPLGGLIFGNLGDKLGRKTILMATVVMMGVASTLMGLLPTTAQVGVWAPILLVSLRIFQGLAVGGEWGGAMLLAFESSKKESRGFASAFAYMGAPAGTIVGTLILSAMSTLPKEEFLSWGWRVPFLFSAVLMMLAVFIRMKVTESKIFNEVSESAQKKQSKVPVAVLFREHRKPLLIAVMSGLSGQMAQGLMGAWAISFAVQQAILAQTEVLNLKAFGGVFTILAIITASKLSDRLGRRKVLIWGNIGAIILAFPVMALLDMGNTVAFLLAIVLGLSIVQGFTAGPYGAFAGELFPTNVRYSGTSIGYQLASTLGAGFTPMIATALVIAGGGKLWLVAAMWMAFSAMSLGALVFAKDRSGSDIQNLDGDLGSGNAAQGPTQKHAAVPVKS